MQDRAISMVLARAVSPAGPPSAPSPSTCPVPPLVFPQPMVQDFSVQVDRSSGMSLGIDVDMQDCHRVLILGIEPGGLIDRWNAMNPGVPVLAGDFIIGVNGIAGHGGDLFQELTVQQPMTLTLQRVTPGNVPQCPQYPTSSTADGTGGYTDLSSTWDYGGMGNKHDHDAQNANLGPEHAYAMYQHDAALNLDHDPRLRMTGAFEEDRALTLGLDAPASREGYGDAAPSSWDLPDGFVPVSTHGDWNPPSNGFAHDDSTLRKTASPILHLDDGPDIRPMGDDLAEPDDDPSICQPCRAAGWLDCGSDRGRSWPPLPVRYSERRSLLHSELARALAQ